MGKGASYAKQKNTSKKFAFPLHPFVTFASNGKIKFCRSDQYIL
jgi:hypothetical protein